VSYQRWGLSNIYESAKIGDGCNIGWFCEIGDGVEIGENTRVGAFSFIPSGVKIGKGCFIGPRATFTNDKYPPSSKEDWQQTVIEDGAAIGAACTILCGITVGAGSLIGAGSVVTKDVPAWEIWCGVPAKRMK
jgi:UDP-2-acetamido-3-amino-2,3-dideoxy-glucuronate N-acetyltransferase